MKQGSLRQNSRRATFRAAIKALTFSGLAAGTILGLSPDARANAENYWIGTTGDFNDPTMWSLGRVPISPAPDGSGSDNADVFNGGTVMITTTGLVPNDVNAGGVGGGTTGDGTFTQTGGDIHIGTSGGWFRLGTTGGTTGTYNLQGGTLNFGNLNGDGTPNNGAQVNVGEAGGATGAINISGGTFNNTIAAPRISVGQGGAGSNGSLSISGGTLNNNGELWIGQGNGSTGVMNMSGGIVNQHNWMAIGRDSGTGTLNMTGGTINKDSASNGGSHLTMGGIGTAQTATLNMTGGAINIAVGGNAIWLGENATGIINISGGAITANDGIAISPFGGSGTLNMQNAIDSTGGLTNGGGAETVVASTISIGGDNNFGTATVNLGGGTLSTGGFTAGGGTGTRTINFNGGTLQATAASDTFLGGTSVTAVVQAGGAIINTNGNDETVTTPLTGVGGADGGLTKSGAGVLTLTGANSYTGTTTVSGGSLVVNNFIGASGSAGAVTVAQGATLGGNGTLNLGTNNATISGILAPGAIPIQGSFGTLTVATSGTLTLASTATLQFDMNNQVGKDLITASGAKLVIQGGTLALTLPGNFNYTMTYTLFTGLASETGNFTTVTGIAGARTAVFSFTGGNYNIAFAAVPEPSTWAMGVFGLGMAAVWLRRRRVA